MAYARFHEGSDLYLVLIPENDGLTCTACRLTACEPWYSDTVLPTPEAALEHLRNHLAAGHKVPGYAWDRVVEDMAQGITAYGDGARTALDEQDLCAFEHIEFLIDEYVISTEPMTEGATALAAEVEQRVRGLAEKIEAGKAAAAG